MKNMLSTDKIMYLVTSLLLNNLTNQLSALTQILINKRVNPRIVKATLEVVWNVSNIVDISHIEVNTFSCQFQKLEDLKLSNSPWSCRGSQIISQKWPKDKAYDEVDSSKTKFWIQSHVSLYKMNSQNIMMNMTLFTHELYD